MAGRRLPVYVVMVASLLRLVHRYARENTTDALPGRMKRFVLGNLLPRLSLGIGLWAGSFSTDTIYDSCNEAMIFT